MVLSTGQKIYQSVIRFQSVYIGLILYLAHCVANIGAHLEASVVHEVGMKRSGEGSHTCLSSMSDGVLKYLG